MLSCLLSTLFCATTLAQDTEVVRTFTGHSSSFESVAVSPDGRYALSGSKDHTVKLWRLSTGEVVRTFTGHSDAIISVAFSPDGRYALSGSFDNTVKLWKIARSSSLALITPPAQVNTQMKTCLEQQEWELEQWQKKGEYESSSAYDRRMMERSAKILDLKQASEAQQELLTKEATKLYRTRCAFRLS